MKFKTLLNEAIKSKGLTGKEVSKLTGISASMISEYRNGVEPTPERKDLLCKTLGIEIPEIEETTDSDVITVAEASRILGISPRLVQLGMKQDRFKPQIGLAVKCEKHWSYTPFKSKVEKWINGE